MLNKFIVADDRQWVDLRQKYIGRYRLGSFITQDEEWAFQDAFRVVVNQFTQKEFLSLLEDNGVAYDIVFITRKSSYQGDTIVVVTLVTDGSGALIVKLIHPELNGNW
jgi:hypothetical protein